MMTTSEVCRRYFNGFNEISNCKANDCGLNTLALLKILSYFTVVLPLSFAVAYGIARLCGRVSHPVRSSNLGQRLNNAANNSRVFRFPQTSLLNSGLPIPPGPGGNLDNDSYHQEYRIFKNTPQGRQFYQKCIKEISNAISNRDQDLYVNLDSMLNIEISNYCMMFVQGDITEHFRTQNRVEVIFRGPADRTGLMPHLRDKTIISIQYPRS